MLCAFFLFKSGFGGPEYAPCPLLESLDHDAGDLFGNRSADGSVQRVSELEANNEVNPRLVVGGVDGSDLPLGDEALENGTTSILDLFPAGRGVQGVGTAQSLNALAGDAAQAAREGLFETTPTHTEVGLYRRLWGIRSRGVGI